jgi:hypothetical protein
MLTLHESGWMCDGRGQNREATAFEVLGLPQSQQAWIANGGYNRQEWQILRVIDGVSGNWSPEMYSSADEALAVLSGNLSQPLG